MKDSEALIEARALIDTPEKWVKGAWHCPPGSMAPNNTISDVSRFCIEGALRHASLWQDYGSGRAQYLRLLNHLSRFVTEIRPELGCVAYAQALNDFSLTTHDDVMALIDKGIASLQEKGL